jgi:MFS family permease
MKGQLTKSQLAAGVAGNALEFYDFLIFGFFAIQIGRVFFPADSATASLLASLAVFGAGFITRPLGGLILGRLGDRIGRKPVMIFTFALMGVSIIGMALTPSYAAIGVAAPVLVLAFRLLQGFALGGEVGPTTAFLLEAAPARRRGQYVSLQNATQYFAVLCVGIIGAILGSTMTAEVFGAWGWRIAMLLGAVVIPFAYVLRRRLPETLHIEPETQAAQPPLRVAALAILIIAGVTISTYTMNYIATYVQHTLGGSPLLASMGTAVAGVASMLGALLGGRLSDRFGRKPVALSSAIAATIAVVPCFLVMLIFPSGPVIATAAAVLAFAISVFPPALLTNIAESFPASLRSGAVGFLYASAVAVFGGSAQYIVTWLIAVTGSPLAPAWYMMGAMVLAIAGMLMLRETAPAKVRD